MIFISHDETVRTDFSSPCKQWVQRPGISRANTIAKQFDSTKEDGKTSEKLHEHPQTITDLAAPWANY